MTQIIVETRLSEIETEIKQHLKRQVDDVIAIGKLATEAKALIPYGGFTEWIKAKLELTPRLIQGYMRVYERFGNEPKSFRLLKIASVLMLASPSTSDGAINEITSRLEQGERFSVEQVESVIDQYRVLEGAKIGSQTLLQNYGTNPDGTPSKSISRSALTSLAAVAEDGLKRGGVTIDGVDYPVNVALPQSVVAAVQYETNQRKIEHVDDNPTKWLYSEALVCEVAADDALRGMGYVTIRVLNREVFDRLSYGQTVTIKVDLKA